MDIGQKIRKIRKSKNITQTELAHMIGISPQQMYRIETGRSNTSFKTLSLIAKALGISEEELLKSEGIDNKLLEVEEQKKVLKSLIDKITSNVTPLSKPLVQIPVYGRVPAGYPREMWHDYIEEYIAIPDAPEGSFGLKVSGDSMIGEGIEEGDTVVIDPNQLAYNGDIVVAVIDGSEFTLKKFYQNAEHVILSPANSHYQPVVLPIESFGERVNIIGVMIGVYKRFKKKNRGGA